MAASKKYPTVMPFQDWLESLHFFDQKNMDIGKGELEPPEDEEDDMEGSFEQELAEMSDSEFIDWYVKYKQSKGNK